MQNVIRRAAVAAGAVVAVLGTGVGVAAASTGDPVLAFTPSPYDYGQVTVGHTAAQTFTLANTGGKASSALTVTVPGSATFTITADTCTGTSLGPGKSCTVTVQFAPASTGTVTATLTAVSQRPGVMATDSLTGTSGRHLYWTDEAGTINEANLDGTTVTTLVTGQNFPQGVAVDGGHIYWANLGSGSIREANLDGTGVTTLVTGQSPEGVAVDSSHIYWANSLTNTIMDANLDGTGVTTLVTDQGGPFGVAVSPQ